MEEYGNSCNNWDEFKTGPQDYIEWYNTERLHWGIDLTTPLKAYTAGFINPEDISHYTIVNKVPR
ncbi:MAG: IS3 family transposase [Thermoplasmata archaeon]|nr:IS3 family transposase [Thermoplasmata archaeon]